MVDVLPSPSTQDSEAMPPSLSLAVLVKFRVRLLPFALKPATGEALAVEPALSETPAKLLVACTSTCQVPRAGLAHNGQLSIVPTTFERQS